jgi:hypothetical protein
MRVGWPGRSQQFIAVRQVNFAQEVVRAFLLDVLHQDVELDFVDLRVQMRNLAEDILDDVHHPFGVDDADISAVADVWSAEVVAAIQSGLLLEVASTLDV